MWDQLSEETLHTLSLHVFKPLELMVNYTLLQYLVSFYWARRREWRVAMLFLVGAIGVACLIPFANSGENLMSHLNDASEACCTVTFLLQMSISGYDLNKKIKFKSILRLTYAADGLMAINMLFAVISLTATLRNGLVGDLVGTQLPNVVENVTMLFILGFRVYFIIISSSWRELLVKRRAELICYVLFATHEMPFEILEWLSGVSWESLQSLYNRLTIAICLFMTIRSKLQAGRMSFRRRTSGPLLPSRVGSASLVSVRSRSGIKRPSNLSTVLVGTERLTELHTERPEESPTSGIGSERH